MNRILVISAHPRAAESLKALVPPDRFGIVHLARPDSIREAIPPACIDLCLIDTDLTDAGAIRLVDEVRRQLPAVPLVVSAANTVREWEEDAILHGVAFVFKKPLRAPLLAAIFARLLATKSDAFPTQPATLTPQLSTPSSGLSALDSRLGVGASSSSPSHLEILRDFSRLFTHSLHVRSLLQEFVLKLREVISVNRIALFLQAPQNPFLPGPTSASRSLPCACSAGIAADLYRFFELSLDGGIGAAIAADGRILRADGPGLSLDTRREFEILGGHIAIPILDRERLLGIAVLGGRLTGLPLGDQELQLLFHLLEELGLAIKNSWLHDQLATNHRLLSNILGQMDAGCLVVARDLTILQANPSVGKLLDIVPPDGRGIEFADLPKQLASLLYQVLNGGSATTRTRFTHGARVLLVTVTAFHLGDRSATSAVLATIEDHTAIEAAHRADADREHDRLIALIAEKFSHEIRNSLLPLETHRQLLPADYAKPEFRTSLESTLGHEVSRILRCVDQLSLLSRAKIAPSDIRPLDDLLAQAAAHASTHLPTPVTLRYPAASAANISVPCDPAALRHALGEIILNAAQSSPGSTEIALRIEPATLALSKLDASDSGAALSAPDSGLGGDSPAVPAIRIGVVNPSQGIDSATAARAFEPFFTTRSVGLGLGLAVTRKVLRDHGGDARIFARPHAALGDIVVTLPIR